MPAARPPPGSGTASARQQGGQQQQQCARLDCRMYQVLRANGTHTAAAPAACGGRAAQRSTARCVGHGARPAPSPYPAPTPHPHLKGQAHNREPAEALQVERVPERRAVQEWQVVAHHTRHPAFNKKLEVVLSSGGCFVLHPQNHTRHPARISVWPRGGRAALRACTAMRQRCSGCPQHAAGCWAPRTTAAAAATVINRRQHAAAPAQQAVTHQAVIHSHVQASIRSRCRANLAGAQQAGGGLWGDDGGLHMGERRA